VNGSKFVTFEFTTGMLLNTQILIDVTLCHWPWVSGFEGRVKWPEKTQGHIPGNSTTFD